jgi:hypothetical protein
MAVRLDDEQRHARSRLICQAKSARWRAKHALYALEHFRREGAPENVLRILAENYWRLDAEASQLEQTVNEGTVESPGVPLVLHTERQRATYAQEEDFARSLTVTRPQRRRGPSVQPVAQRRQPRPRGAGRPRARRTSRLTRAGPDEDGDPEPAGAGNPAGVDTSRTLAGLSPRFSTPRGDRMTRRSTLRPMRDVLAGPFADFLPKLSPHERCIADAQLSATLAEAPFLIPPDEESEAPTEGDWRLIQEQARFEAEVALCPDPLLAPYEPRKKGGYQPRQRSKAATSTRLANVVPFEGFDPLKAIPPDVYVEALTGEEVPRNGYLRCPLPGHEDRTPSFQVLNSHWRCFGCNRGGGVIDLAAGLYGIEPRGRGYQEIRRRLTADLGLRRTAV